MGKRMAAVLAVVLMVVSGGAGQANQTTGMIEGQYAGLVVGLAPITEADDSDSAGDRVCIAVHAAGDTAHVKLIVHADGARQDMFAAHLPLQRNPVEANTPHGPGSMTFHLLQGIFPSRGGATNYGGERRLFEGRGWRGYLGVTNTLVVQMNNSVTPLPEGLELRQFGGTRLSENAHCDTLLPAVPDTPLTPIDPANTETGEVPRP